LESGYETKLRPGSLSVRSIERKKVPALPSENFFATLN
jgi:hypothetical protein